MSIGERNKALIGGEKLETLETLIMSATTQIVVTVEFAQWVKDMGATYAAKSKSRDSMDMTQWEVCNALQAFTEAYQFTPGDEQAIDADGNPVFDTEGNPVFEELDTFAPYAKEVTDARMGKTRESTAKRDLAAARENVKRFLLSQGLSGEALEKQLCALCGGGTPA